MRREQLERDALRRLARESRDLTDAPHQRRGVGRTGGEEVARAIDQQTVGGTRLHPGGRGKAVGHG
jgi:hypothetical protein